MTENKAEDQIKEPEVVEPKVEASQDEASEAEKFNEAQSKAAQSNADRSNAEQSETDNEQDSDVASAQQQHHESAEIEVVEKSAFDALQAKADEYQQRFLRAQADLENFRRRTRMEQAEAAKYGALSLIEQLLPVIDNFERAMATSDENKDYDALMKGIEMIYNQMLHALEQEGLQPIEAVGEKFDPQFHQAVMQVDSEDHEEGIVVEELQKGYILKERVLRPSMVKVSK